MFSIIQGDQVIINSDGVFRQCDLYSYDGGLFAKFGSGWIRLNRDGTTSKPKIRVIKLITDLPLYADNFGRLTTKKTAVSVPAIGKE